ncbi:hypothetical protein CRT60_00470 [Azospirillum palustre]|uniref:HTH luxR-type domain-containing protein n=1 Tax=Azospirillum palustre TaxID=2044885 RepID=A0A2B8BNE5_9PROT|nr:LuxR family transcriptional regulator [Azospirillum palustre]PGH59441.1 hypothetical protein CRT60_00470 [Azospirillum palustre]
MRVGFLDDIASLDACKTGEEIARVVDGVATSLGFAGFSFLDVRNIGSGSSAAITPYYLTTARADFVAEYASQRLYEIDPIAHLGKRANLAFSWSELLKKPRHDEAQDKKAGAEKVMGFALDHGYRDGLTIPFHGVSGDGSPVSSLTTLFWTGPQADFEHIFASERFSLQMFTHYCNDRVAAIRGSENVLASIDQPSLSGRERDCLSWSARGKTAAEVAMILGISENTVNFHFKNTMRKIGVHTKTHAVSRAIALGLIVP